MADASETPPSRKIGLMGGVTRPVFFWSVGITLVFVLSGVIAPEASAATFAAVQGWIVSELGWIYLLAVAVFLMLMLYLGVSSYGSIKLGPNHSEPDFSYPAWFSMLFAA